MQDLLKEIQAGLNYKLYYLSLFATLAIPDIGRAIDSENGEASGEKYEKWFDTYVASKYGGFVTGKDCYSVRCRFLHQGSSQRSSNPRDISYQRILFVEPSDKMVFHNNIINDALNIDIGIFCGDVITGATKWLEEKGNTDLFEKNHSKFVRRYPNGLEPYISGIPVIS